MKRLPVLLGLALSAGAAQAAEVTEDVFLADLPMVLTASRIEQSTLDAPAPVTVIDRESIRASGFTEIHDLLRLVPGFLVADWPEGSPVVVNHGLGDAHSRRMQVLIDGRSVYDAYWGGVDWQDLPLRVEDIERIEVVRGPSQAVYGANAFQGVINIITREPAADYGQSVVLARGRRGLQDNYARFGRSQGDLDWRVSLSTRAMSSFEDRGVKPMHWGEDLERQVLNARLSYRPDNRQEWTLQFGLSRGEDRAGTTLEANKYPFHKRAADGDFVQIAWRNSYAAGSELSLQYYHFGRTEREAYLKSNDPISPSEWLPVNYDLDVRRDDIEFQQIHSFSPVLRAVWGLGLRRDAAESGHYLYQMGTVGGTQWQWFGNLDWQATPDWLLHAGAMVERHYLTDTLVSPRIAANYRLAANHTLRISMGKGYRAPTLFEGSTHEVDRNPAGGVADVGYWAALPLDPESVTFQEIGYVGRYPGLGLNVDTRLFSDQYDKYIDSRSCKLEASPNGCPFDAPAGYARPSWFGNSKAFYFYNSGDLRVFGGDLTLDWSHPIWGRFIYSVAYTRIKAGSMTDLDAEVSAPIHTSSLLWSKAFPHGWSVSLGRYHVGFLKWPDDGDEQWPYDRVDLKLAKRLGRSNSGDEISLTLQNVNSRHTEFDEYLVERQAFVTLRLGW
ncbi:MAG: TonB-dependent receptor [Gallionellaceae bacterium]|nr:TonB-dependent receptor [Gallionellaceae bacterium]MDD5366279.1 TonB-dependent receptor [Gallionellaceae bacterium]